MTAFIKGLYGCSCHPFSSWEECDRYHKQKLKIGDAVKNRHTGIEGTIYRVHKEKGFVTVKVGPLPRDLHLEHVALLETIQLQTEPSKV